MTLMTPHKRPRPNYHSKQTRIEKTHRPLLVLAVPVGGDAPKVAPPSGVTANRLCVCVSTCKEEFNNLAKDRN